MSESCSAQKSKGPSFYNSQKKKKKKKQQMILISENVVTFIDNSE